MTPSVDTGFDLPGLVRLGRVSALLGPVVNVTGVKGNVGDFVKFYGEMANARFGEIIGLGDESINVVPLGSSEGFSHDTLVEVLQSTGADTVEVETSVVVDGLGFPLNLDEFEEQRDPRLLPPVIGMDKACPSLSDRRAINEMLATGVRALDLCVPLAKGQRVALLAPAGVGKSTLMTMLLGGVDADRVVLCLVGERGREAVELIEVLRDQDLMHKAYVVVSTSDRPSAERAKAPLLAMLAAERFAEQGHSVLILIDSLTRYCRALREISLAAGEAPTRRGYPSSVFAALPQLLERAGNFNEGSITLVASVLVEDELMPDPIAEEVQSLSDGHIWLSRSLAAKGHYPAIDVLKSISRLAGAVQNSEQRTLVQNVRRALSNSQQQETLIRMGEYRWGLDEAMDKDLKASAGLLTVLAQPTTEYSSVDETFDKFTAAMA
jgi:ATP synthase in type III secretion protein N